MLQNQSGRNPTKWDKTGVAVEVRPHEQIVVKVDGSRRRTLRIRRLKGGPYPEQMTTVQQNDDQRQPPAPNARRSTRSLLLLPTGTSPKEPLPPTTLPPPRSQMQDPICLIPTLLTAASVIDNENHPEAALDLIDGPRHEATADQGEGLQGPDGDKGAVQGQPRAGGEDEGVWHLEGRPIRQRKPNPKYSSDVYDLNFARTQSRRTIQSAL